jgi:hypothetical protein
VLDEDMLKMGQIHAEPDGRFNTQPFHWFTAFYEILSNGGFDVIVGNPPYVEYSKIKGDKRVGDEDRYRIYGYKTESCNNLYAFMIERGLKMTHEIGRFGMIVPLSALCTQRMLPVWQIIEDNSTHLHTSHFGWRPAKLFVGPYTTRYNKWSAEGRTDLFSLIHYMSANKNLIKKGVVSKISNELEDTLIQKVISKQTTINSLTSESISHLVYYKNTGVNHWITATDFAPKAFRDDNPTESSRQTTLGFIDNSSLDFVACCLNSNLFFWFYTVRTNCRDLNPNDIRDFPIPRGIEKDERFAKLRADLMERLDASSKYIIREQKLTGAIRLQSFYPQSSKPIIDEIDRVLAQHYGFTDEELDFIINYDIKYRMGRDAAGAGDDDKEIA